MTERDTALVCDILDKYIRQQRQQAASDRRDSNEYWQRGEEWNDQGMYNLGDTMKQYAEQREAEADEVERIRNKLKHD